LNLTNYASFSDAADAEIGDDSVISLFAATG